MQPMSAAEIRERFQRFFEERGHTRELTSNVEVLSEDVAVKLDRLSDLMNSLQHSLEGGQLTLAAGPTAGRSGERPVESWETREDAPDA